MNESKDKSIAFNVRLKPVDHSNLPLLANHSHAGLAKGIACLDFGFIEPSLLGAMARATKQGLPAPKTIDGQFVTRVAMGVDVLARLHQQIPAGTGRIAGCEAAEGRPGGSESVAYE